ncbi:DUF1643 domain-containing protein [Lysinibacillus sp. SGAir0095]|uniref:DUF1643 domain-containing protein n=1 Tax=Lysinibacillus sp. SGAir0095 TaxID=2070463 RepID=UPI0010CD14AD|nr:DUF1643 domain-containing protein [Lysinibacillus sp. SGAir0095]QCR30880.1 hypothetical protein C1N55_01150 [Lysinibacillus sp. SGAir0095]
MENVKAIATFQLIGEEVYRTNTYIQFGSSRKSLGAVIMLNPGSADLKGEARKKLIMNGSHTDETTIDNTLRQLIQFMKASHTCLEGRLHIYNLFYVRNTASVEAIELFELLKATGKYPTITLPSLFEMTQHPWILIGWGVEKRSRWRSLEEEKREWLQLINDSGVPSFGIKSENNEYYHPCPKGPAKTERLQQLIQAYNLNIKPLTLKK